MRIWPIIRELTPSNLSYRRTHQAIDDSLHRLGIDVIDLFLIHRRSRTPLEDAFRALNEAQRLSDMPIVTNQVPYSVASREYVRNGVIPYGQEQGIVVTAYSPVDAGKLDMQRDLEQIAAAHKATPYQIALAWLMQQPRVITIHICTTMTNEILAKDKCKCQ